MSRGWDRSPGDKERCRHSPNSAPITRFSAGFLLRNWTKIKSEPLSGRTDRKGGSCDLLARDSTPQVNLGPNRIEVCRFVRYRTYCITVLGAASSDDDSQRSR